MLEPMEMLAELARRHGVDPDDEDAVVDFLENSSDRIPSEEAEPMVAALAARTSSRAPWGEPLKGPADDLPFPKLHDARREAFLHESPQHVEPPWLETKANRDRPARVVLRAQEAYLTSTLVGRAALTLVILTISILMPGGFGATSSFGRMIQTALAVTAALSLLSGVDKLSIRLFQRAGRHRGAPSQTRRRS